MATITSAASGLASAGSTWVGGSVPVEGDKVIIAAGHVVELDGAFTWGDDSVTTVLPNAAINVYGTLKASRTVNSSLTGKGLILLGQGNTTGIDFGTAGDPIPSGITAELILNKATTPAVRLGLVQSIALATAGNGASIHMHSADTRVRGVPLASTAAAAVTTLTLTSSAHNWQVGDTVLLFTTTDNSLTNECEFRTISAISGATITISAGLTYAHLAGSPVANMSSNIRVRSFNEVTGQTARVDIRAPNSASSSNSYYFHFNGVEFCNVGRSSGAMIDAQTNPVGGEGLVSVSFGRCIFRNTVDSSAVLLSATWTQFPAFDNCCIYVSGALVTTGGGLPATLKNSFVACTSLNLGEASKYEASWVTAIGSGNLLGPYSGVTFNNITISGNGGSLLSRSAIGVAVNNCDLGYTYGWRMTFGSGAVSEFSTANYESAVFNNCRLHPRFTTPDNPSTDIAGRSEFVSISYVNKDLDVAEQEVWLGAGTIKRENTIVNRGSSSIALGTYSTVRPLTRTQSVPCAAGATIRVVGYVRMDTAYWNAGDNSLPTVTLTGLGATPVTFTASSAGNNAWEKFDLSITNTSGADGNFTLTYTANAKTVSTGTVYFDGVPDSPFITKVRHYGFLFNETSPTREVNPYTVASEATAAAYTGTTINATTKRVSFGIGTADTLNKVYDYSQAWAVLNIDKEVPWQRAGALLSLTSGWTVVDPVITGVTWGGGTIEWNTPGAINGSFDSTTFRFNAAGTYDLSGGTFAGTINLTNTSGGGVIVIVLPSGIDYVNDDPGTITVEVAVESATASITNIVPGSRLQVYNVTEDTEMVNTIVAGTSWTASYPNGTGYSTGDVVRVRLAWMDGVAAKLPVQYQTVAASGGWSILADQVDDTVYNYNAIDGDTCTEFSHDFANVQVDVDDADNTTTVQRGYAWFIAGQMTADGIRYFFGGITAEDSVNYRINAALVNLRIQNIKAGSNLTVTGGNIYRTDDTDIFAPGASGSTASMRYGRAYTVRVGGGTGLSPEESAKLMSLPSAATVATAVDASTVLAKEATALAAKNNAALAAALSA